MSQIKLEAGQWYRTRGGEIVYCVGEMPAIDTAAMYAFAVWDSEGSLHPYIKTGGWSTVKSSLDIVEHLPGCTGFDWKPPKPLEPPDGYRFLTKGETIRDTDLWHEFEWNPLPFDADEIGKPYNPDWIVMARRIESKRPDAPDGWRWLDEDEVAVKSDRYWRRDSETFQDLPWFDEVFSNVGKTWRDMVDMHENAWGILRKIKQYRPFANADEFKPHRDKWIVTEAVYNGFEKILSYDDHRVYSTLGECTVWWSYKDAMERFTFEDGTPFGVEVIE